MSSTPEDEWTNQPTILVLTFHLKKQILLCYQPTNQSISTPNPQRTQLDTLPGRSKPAGCFFKKRRPP